MVAKHLLSIIMLEDSREISVLYFLCAHPYHHLWVLSHHWYQILSQNKFLPDIEKPWQYVYCYEVSPKKAIVSYDSILDLFIIHDTQFCYSHSLIVMLINNVHNMTNWSYSTLVVVCNHGYMESCVYYFMNDHGAFRKKDVHNWAKA